MAALFDALSILRLRHFPSMAITSPSVSVAKSATHLEKHSLNSSVSINAKTSPKVSCEGIPFSSLNSSVNQLSFASPNYSMAPQLSAPHMTAQSVIKNISCN